MAKSEAVKVARIELQKQRETAFLEITRDLLRSPIIELVGGFVLIEYLQRTPSHRPIIGNMQGNALEAGISGLIALQQLSPILPLIAASGKDVMSTATKLAPLLLG